MSPLPPGALTLAGFLVLVAGVVAGVALLAGPGWACIAGGILAGVALISADGLRDDKEQRRG